MSKNKEIYAALSRGGKMEVIMGAYALKLKRAWRGVGSLTWLAAALLFAQSIAVASGWGRWSGLMEDAFLSVMIMLVLFVVCSGMVLACEVLCANMRASGVVSARMIACVVAISGLAGGASAWYCSDAQKAWISEAKSELVGVDSYAAAHRVLARMKLRDDSFVVAVVRTKLSDELLMRRLARSSVISSAGRNELESAIAKVEKNVVAVPALYALMGWAAAVFGAFALIEVAFLLKILVRRIERLRERVKSKFYAEKTKSRESKDLGYKRFLVKARWARRKACQLAFGAVDGVKSGASGVWSMMRWFGRMPSRASGRVSAWGKSMVDSALDEQEVLAKVESKELGAHIGQSTRKSRVARRL